MSDSVNDSMSSENVIAMEIISTASTNVTNIDGNSETVPIVKDEMIEIVNLTLHQMFETFLLQNKEELEKYNIKLNPELKNYFLILCKENAAFFTEIEDNFNLIILDNTINIKDIPELLKMTIKIYEIIKHKNVRSNADPYEIIETILHVLFMLYIQTNKRYDAESANESVNQIVKIIKVAVELLKLSEIKMPANSCFSRLLKK
jgi:hypothetical protein